MPSVRTKGLFVFFGILYPELSWWSSQLLEDESSILGVSVEAVSVLCDFGEGPVSASAGIFLEFLAAFPGTVFPV